MNQPVAFYNNSVQSLSSIQSSASTNSSNQSLGTLQVLNQSLGPLQVTSESGMMTYQDKQYIISNTADFYTTSDPPITESVTYESTNQTSEQSHEEGTGEEPVIDIIINNVVCTFNTRCHLNLKRIAMEGMNVIYKRENGMVSMKVRNPQVTASIWSSGKVTTTGSNSAETARESCRKVARCLQRLGFKIRFTSFRVVNVLGTCSFPFSIRVPEFTQANASCVCYEPELHPGATYRITNPRATLKIFSTGSVTVTAPSIANVQSAIEHIYPLVYEFRADRSAYNLSAAASIQHAGLGLEEEEDDDDELNIANIRGEGRGLKRRWDDESDVTGD